ncbi:hypothetical protein MNV49_004624 [Pseudohyphozyma bogoriensis]|nr:hypothetical protein MNV49_004624 [Pseudohyphozyma bogoriensis]
MTCFLESMEADRELTGHWTPDDDPLPPTKRRRLSTSLPSPSTNDDDETWKRLFTISTLPTLPDTQFNEHLYSYIDSPSSHLPILGVDPSPSPPTPPRPTRKCFNCSSPDHISSQCPWARNPALQAANRKAFAEDHPNAGEGAKLGGETEKMRMVGFVERFKPGVVGSELREALGFSRGLQEGIEWPWFERFELWGYPPGWEIEEGETDPMDVVKARLGHPSMLRSAQSFTQAPRTGTPNIHTPPPPHGNEGAVSDEGEEDMEMSSDEDE